MWSRLGCKHNRILLWQIHTALQGHCLLQHLLAPPAQLLVYCPRVMSSNADLFIRQADKGILRYHLLRHTRAWWTVLSDPTRAKVWACSWEAPHQHCSALSQSMRWRFLCMSWWWPSCKNWNRKIKAIDSNTIRNVFNKNTLVECKRAEISNYGCYIISRSSCPLNVCRIIGLSPKSTEAIDWLRHFVCIGWDDIDYCI